MFADRCGRSYRVKDEIRFWSDNKTRPTGEDEFSHGSWSMDLNFGIYATCKQIYHETRNMFWKLNTLVLKPERFSSKTAVFYAHRLVHLDLEVDFSDYRRKNADRPQYFFGTEAFSRSLPMLEKLVNTGTLKTLTLSPTRGISNVLVLGHLKRLDPMDARVEAKFWVGQQFRECLQLLNSAAFICRHLKRKIVIVTGWHSLSLDDQVRVYQSAIVEFEAALEALKDMHKAFGGELWVDGTLCFSGVQLSQPFKLDPDAEERVKKTEEIPMELPYRHIGTVRVRAGRISYSDSE